MTDKPRLAKSDPELLMFARCATDYASLITDRWDIIVRAGKGLGRGAPACFIPATAEIEIDVDACTTADQPRLDKIGWPLSVIDMARPKHRNLIPVTTGALAHECGHSLYSKWLFNPAYQAEIKASPRQVVDLAVALEEGRQESRIITRNPAVKAYVQRMLNAVILPGMAKVPPDDPYALMHAAALLYPRVHAPAGVRTYANVGALNGHLDAIGIGAGKLIEAMKRECLWDASADDDLTCLKVARAWWDLLPEEAKDSTPSDGSMSCPAHEGEASDSDGPGEDALADTKECARYYEEEGSEEEDKEAVRAARESDKAVGGKEATTRKRAKGLHGHTMSSGGSGVRGRRAPSAVETATAKRLGAILRSAQTVSKVRTPKAVPPGRLRGRAAVEWSRDRSMGRATDVSLFRGKARGDAIPPVRMGIAMDVSGSMSGVCHLAASLGWTLAASAWDAEALVSGVCFGGALYPYVEVGKAHSDVRTLAAEDGTELIFSAVEYLDKELDLMSGEGPRILVIISDGAYVHPEERKKAAKWLTDFVRSGGVLIYVGMTEDSDSSLLRGFPLPGKGHVTSVPADLATLTATIGAAIRRAYARM